MTAARYQPRIAIARNKPWPLACRTLRGERFNSFEDALLQAGNEGRQAEMLRTGWGSVHRFEPMFSRGDNASRHAPRVTGGYTTWVECCPRCQRPRTTVEGGCTGGSGGCTGEVG